MRLWRAFAQVMCVSSAPLAVWAGIAPPAAVLAGTDPPVMNGASRGGPRSVPALLPRLREVYRKVDEDVQKARAAEECALEKFGAPGMLDRAMTEHTEGNHARRSRDQVRAHLRAARYSFLVGRYPRHDSVVGVQRPTNAVYRELYKLDDEATAALGSVLHPQALAMAHISQALHLVDKRTSDSRVQAHLERGIILVERAADKALMLDESQGENRDALSAAGYRLIDGIGAASYDARRQVRLLRKLATITERLSHNDPYYSLHGTLPSATSIRELAADIAKTGKVTLWARGSTEVPELLLATRSPTLAASWYAKTASPRRSRRK